MAIPTIVPRLSRDAIFGNAVGAAQLISSTLAQDVVAVYNQETLEQVFPYARPMEMTQQESAKVMDYPVENGSLISDHKIILPIVIEMPIVVPIGDYLATYQQIKSLWERDVKLIVQTKTDVLYDFIIEQLPQKQSPDAFDKAMIRLRLREVQIVTSPSKFATAEPENQDTVKRGQIAATPPPTSAPTIVAGSRMTPAVIQYSQGTNPTGGRFGGVINNSKPLNISGK